MRNVGTIESNSGTLKYIFLILTIFFLAGCHKDLTPVKPSASVHPLTDQAASVEQSLPAEQKIAIDNTPVTIDTLHYPIRTRVSSINTNNRYFDKKVRAKSAEFYLRNNYQTKWLGERHRAVCTIRLPM